MRITSKIMQSNSLTNMNRNKILHDKLNTQMTTMKKLTKASDDPVVAIRALRLRTSVSEITQYAKKNVPDARSWMDVTEDYLVESSGVLTDIISQCNTGRSSYNSLESQKAILKAITSLRDQIYSAADADYAGRGLFTGYRTETKATFQTNTTQKYSITEQLSRKDIETLRYIKGGATENAVKDDNIQRIRLAYGNLDPEAVVAGESNVSMTIVKDKGKATVTDATGGGTEIKLPPRGTQTVGDTVTLKKNASGEQEISIPGAVPPITSDNVDGKSNYTYTNAAGEQVTIGLDVKNKETSLDSNYTINETINVITSTDPYNDISLPANDRNAIFVPETGELLLGKDLNTKLNNLSDNDEVRISYDKSEWKKGDLSPVHYFSCETQKDGKTVEYNPNYLTEGKSLQEIEYDVGYNQTIRVNTTADEVFSHDIGRDVDELMAILQRSIDLESTTAALKAAAEKDPTNGTAQDDYKAALREKTLVLDQLGGMFGSTLTNMQGYMDNVNVAVADLGTRGARLDMIENRLTTQLTTFDILASENENIDLSEVAIQLGSVELAYEAALMAVGKVAQTSLLNYI